MWRVEGEHRERVFTRDETGTCTHGSSFVITNVGTYEYCNTAAQQIVPMGM